MMNSDMSMVSAADTILTVVYSNTGWTVPIKLVELMKSQWYKSKVLTYTRILPIHLASELLIVTS